MELKHGWPTTGYLVIRISKGICTPMVFAVCLIIIIAKKEKQKPCKYQLTMNGKQNGCTQNITQPLKGKEILAHATAYVILKGIVLREIIKKTNTV